MKNKQRSLILTIVIGIIMLIMTAIIIFLPKLVNADTLICQTIMEDPPRVLIISMKDKDIKDINALYAGFSIVKYNDGRTLYISPNTFACHETVGKNDEKEQQLVDFMVDMITGGGLE